MKHLIAYSVLVFVILVTLGALLIQEKRYRASEKILVGTHALWMATDLKLKAGAYLDVLDWLHSDSEVDKQKAKAVIYVFLDSYGDRREALASPPYSHDFKDQELMSRIDEALEKYANLASPGASSESTDTKTRKIVMPPRNKP